MDDRELVCQELDSSTGQEQLQRRPPVLIPSLHLKEHTMNDDAVGDTCDAVVVGPVLLRDRITLTPLIGRLRTG